ncbi:unnamed protein product [Closterium sp. NIES-54]
MLPCAAACATAAACAALAALLLRCCCSSCCRLRYCWPSRAAMPSRLCCPPCCRYCCYGESRCCLAQPLTFSALSEFASVADVGGGSGAGKSGGGGQQQLESSCVAARAPTSKGAVPAEALLSVPVALDDPTPGLVYAHPFESSGSTEGGDPGAADSATSCRSPRLEAPPGFPPRTSSPPLQPVAMDFGGPCVFGEGDAEGAGFGGTGYGGVDSGGARCPLVGGVGGTGARGVPGTGGPSVCARGAGSVGASQTLPWRPIFLEQPSSSLLESALHHLLRLPTALTSLVFSSCRS